MENEDSVQKSFLSFWTRIHVAFHHKRETDQCLCEWIAGPIEFWFFEIALDKVFKLSSLSGNIWDLDLATMWWSSSSGAPQIQLDNLAPLTCPCPWKSHNTEAMLLFHIADEIGSRPIHILCDYGPFYVFSQILLYFSFCAFTKINYIAIPSTYNIMLVTGVVRNDYICMYCKMTMSVSLADLCHHAQFLSHIYIHMYMDI